MSIAPMPYKSKKFRLPKAIRAKIKFLRFLKLIKMNPLIQKLCKKKKIKISKIPTQPEFQYLLNDVGKYGRDQKMEIIVTSLYGIKPGSAKNPLDYHPPHIASSNLTKERKLATSIKKKHSKLKKKL